MGLPTLQKTWILTTNNRITFVSLNDTMARYLFGVKAFLKANGYTVVGSSNGSAAAIDGVDRWSTFSDATTRGAGSGNPQSWIILRDGNGVDVLIAFQGASDDIARIAFSPGQIYVEAGTPTNQPTATDEQVVTSAATLINATASIDRIWHGWVTSDFKMCRFAVMRAAAWVGRHWGIELITSAVVSPATFSPAVWGFRIDAAGSSILSNGTQAGVARPSVLAVPFNASIFFGMEMYNNNPTFASAVKQDWQSSGYYLAPMSLWSSTTGARGKLGNVIDAWYGRSNAEHGSTYGSARQLIAIGTYLSSSGASGAWPWNGSIPLLY